MSGIVSYSSCDVFKPDPTRTSPQDEDVTDIASPDANVTCLAAGRRVQSPNGAGISTTHNPYNLIQPSSPAPCPPS